VVAEIFDQIRLFPVSAEELLEIRDAFPHGKYSLHIEPSDFNVRRYREFLGQISVEPKTSRNISKPHF